MAAPQYVRVDVPSDYTAVWTTYYIYRNKTDSHQYECADVSKVIHVHH
jgi:hypothetical protein